MNTIGTLHVEWGGMFSGKTESLIGKMKRAQYAQKKVQMFKPALDNRDEATIVKSHSGDELIAVSVDSSFEILTHLDPDTKTVGIDETQFFDENIVDVIRILKRTYGVDVVVSGLDMWSSGEPVILMAKLAAIANTVTKHRAICVVSGKDAYLSYTHQDKQGSDILVGASTVYEAVSEEVYLSRKGEL